jgi:hypothetical protein
MAAVAPDLSALDIDALRAMVLEQHAVIERLQTMIAHLRRIQCYVSRQADSESVKYQKRGVVREAFASPGPLVAPPF